LIESFKTGGDVDAYNTLRSKAVDINKLALSYGKSGNLPSNMNKLSKAVATYTGPDFTGTAEHPVNLGTNMRKHTTQLLNTKVGDIKSKLMQVGPAQARLQTWVFKGLRFRLRGRL